MPAVIVPGDVVVLFDVLTTPPKTKWFCSVCVAESWFLRINTEPRHHGLNVPVFQSENSFLDHDSHLDCKGIIFKDARTIQEILKDPSNYKGRLSDKAIRTVVDYLRSVPTIPPIQKQKILPELESALKDG